MKILLPKLPHTLQTPSDGSGLLAHEESVTDVLVENADLTGLTSKHLSISESRVSRTDFSQTVIERFETLGTEYRGCNFTASKLDNSTWHVILVNGARCSGMQVSNSTLKNVTFKNCKIELTNFRFSSLENVIFEDCALNDADFYNAKLKNVSFINCSVNKIIFAGAKMINVDVSKSQIDGIRGIDSLRGITISYDQMMLLAPLLAAEAGLKIATL